MKKLFKKGLPLFMVGLMFMSFVVPTFATVSENQTITTLSTGITQVYYNQESTFGITIPKLIDLGSDKETNYTVTITGDISSDETILVVPDESFLMKDTNTSSPKDDVTATVTQDKTEWKFNEFETIGNGKVSAPDLTAGKWEGKFYFNVKLQNCNISVTAKDKNGNDLNASASYITGTEKENLLNSLVDSGYVNSIDEVDALINVDSDEFDGIADTTFDVSDTYSKGDTVAILHYNEETKEWEYIGTETVDENGLINGDFTSYSPVAFIKVNSDGSYSKVFESGLYDNNDVMIYSWDELLTNNYIAVTNGEAEAINKTALVGKLVFDKSVTTIKSLGFYSCDNLTAVILPNTITTLGAGAFEYCSNLQSINVPSSIRTMEENFCYGTPKLVNVNIENGCKVLGVGAFASQSNLWDLKNITIPGSIEVIGSSAFSNSSLTTVIIKEGVKEIGSNAFNNCGKLREIYIPKSVTIFGPYSFKKCDSLKTIYYSGTQEEWNAITKGYDWNYDWPSYVNIVYNYTE